jgi:hypothetical protein
MDKRNVKIGELKFELLIPADAEDMPVLEIENEASMVYENVGVTEALRLRKLLDQFIEEAGDS